MSILIKDKIEQSADSQGNMVGSQITLSKRSQVQRMCTDDSMYLKF